MKKIVKKFSVIFAGAISVMSLSACAGLDTSKLPENITFYKQYAYGGQEAWRR